MPCSAPTSNPIPVQSQIVGKQEVVRKRDYRKPRLFLAANQFIAASQGPSTNARFYCYSGLRVAAMGRTIRFVPPKGYFCMNPNTPTAGLSAVVYLAKKP